MTTDLALILSQIIITACFIGVILVILTDKINRAIISLVGALIVFFALVFLNNAAPSDFIDILFGISPGFVSLHALVLIIGMLFIVQICSSAGVFQFIAFKLIKMTKGKPIRLIFSLCAITMLVAAILGNILAVIVLIPLTITASRILNIDPRPYIICQAITIPIGEIVFSISSVPSILITSYAQIGFVDYFLNVGLFCLLLFIITLIYFSIYHRNKLNSPKSRLIEVLMDFNAWNYVPDKRLFYKSIIIFVAVLIGFIIIPSALIPPDIIALTGGITLVVINRLNGKEIVQKLDLELLLYLLGIFLITGGMEYVKVIDAVGQAFAGLAGGNTFTLLLATLWISALLSSAVDNIPITKVLIPIVDVMTRGYPASIVKSSYYSLAFGMSLGDNLTPLGDTIMTRNVSEQNGVTFSNAQFFRIAFKVALIHLITLSIYFTFFFYIAFGLFIIFLAFLFIFLIIFLRYLTKSSSVDETLLFSNALRKLKDVKYRRNKKLIFREFLKKIITPNQKKDWKKKILNDAKRFLKEMM